MSSFEERPIGWVWFEGLLQLCTLSKPSNATHRPAGVCRN